MFDYDAMPMVALWYRNYDTSSRAFYLSPYTPTGTTNHYIFGCSIDDTATLNTYFYVFRILSPNLAAPTLSGYYYHEIS